MYFSKIVSFLGERLSSKPNRFSFVNIFLKNLFGNLKSGADFRSIYLKELPSLAAAFEPLWLRGSADNGNQSPPDKYFLINHFKVFINH